MLWVFVLWIIVLHLPRSLGADGQTETVTYDDARVRWTPSILSANKTQNCFKNEMQPTEDKQCLGAWVKTDDVAWLQPWSGIHGIGAQVSSTQTSVSVNFNGSRIQVFGGSFLMPGFTIGIGAVEVDNTQQTVNFTTSFGQVFQSGTLDANSKHVLKIDFAKFTASAFVYIDHFVILTDSVSPTPPPKTSSSGSSNENADASTRNATRFSSQLQSTVSSTSFVTTTASASSETGFSASVTGQPTRQPSDSSASVQPSTGTSSSLTPSITSDTRKTLPLGDKVGFAIFGIVVLLVLTVLLVIMIKRWRQHRSESIGVTAPYNLHSNGNSVPPTSHLKFLGTAKEAQQDSESHLDRSTLSRTGSTDSRGELVALQSAMDRAGLSAHTLMALLRAPRQEDAERPPNYES